MVKIIKVWVSSFEYLIRYSNNFEYPIRYSDDTLSCNLIHMMTHYLSIKLDTQNWIYVVY